MLCTDWNETWVVASHHVTDMSAMMRLSWVRSLPSNGALNIQQLRASESPASQLSLTMIVCTYIHCVPKKTCDHVFDDKLKQNCPFTKIFGTLITKSTGHWQVFLFSHLTYFMQLLYLGKLSIPKYQQKLNKIMKISQEDVILIKNLYLSKQCGARSCWANCPTRVGIFEASTVCWREATRRVQLSRFQAALDRFCRVAVKNFVLNQEDKPKRHRSTR